jgi:SAM-dependent methyltransferase
MGRLDDEAFVQEQYRSTDGLETRISVWRPGPDGVSPQDVAVAALAEAHPSRLLEVGPGTGALAERCARELACTVVALDISEEMARTTRARGIDARVGDVQALPFADGEFDCALAAWMLYHVPDLDLAIAEIARVLRPGGRLVAVTNGRDHLGELYRLVDATKLESSFDADNGSAILGRAFANVERRDVAAQAVFGDRATAASYLETLDRGELASRLPDGPWPLVARSATAVFVADLA